MKRAQAGPVEADARPVEGRAGPVEGRAGPVDGGGGPADAPALVRVGILVTVPDPLRTRLARWRRLFGDPLADAVPPHITLLAPATVPSEMLPEIEEHLRAVAAAQRPFGVALRGSGSFRPVSPVVFAALSAGRAACERLQARIRTGPLALPLSFPYYPHVTVAHGVTEPVLDAAEHLLADLSEEFGVRSVDLYRAPPPVAGSDAGPLAAGAGEWVLHRRFGLGRTNVLGRTSAVGRAGAAGRAGAVSRSRPPRERSASVLATGSGT